MTLIETVSLFARVNYQGAIYYQDSDSDSNGIILIAEGCAMTLIEMILPFASTNTTRLGTKGARSVYSVE
jgi:hypothetical protein